MELFRQVRFLLKSLRIALIKFYHLRVSTDCIIPQAPGPSIALKDEQSTSSITVVSELAIHLEGYLEQPPGGIERLPRGLS